MDKERHPRSHRDDRDRDRESSIDRSPEREAGRKHRDGDSKRRDSDHYRSSKRDDRDDERDRGKDRARDSRRSVDRSEREGSRDREKHHHERSHEGKESRSKRKERDDENGVKEGKKKSRFSDGNGERRSRFEESEVTQGLGAMNTTSDVPIVASSYSSVASETSLASSQTLLTKVSSISTTDENKGVSNVRSHEVHGKSSTDGNTTSSSMAGKTSGNLSLDAVAKAKRAILMGKGLADKLKNLPSLNKGATKVPASSATTTPPVSAGTSTASAQPNAGIFGLGGIDTIEAAKKVKKAQELIVKMGYHQDRDFSPFINLFPTAETAVAQKPIKTPVLRVDALGREIDENGNVISATKPSNLSTLKVNINKKKKDAFQILKPQLEVDPAENAHYDPRMGIDKQKILRPKRMSFQFVEEGKWTRDAESLKLKSQFGEAKARELKVKQAHLANAKDDINPNFIEVSERVPRKEKPKETIPDVEWWDASILIDGAYGDIADDTVTDSHLKIEKLTHYVEHPRPIDPPAEAAPPPPQPLKLTKREQKKLRTQRRVAKEKEKQEMIRQGLLEPPKSKVKMSNLMRVLGSEATQDPTKLEREIRTAAAEREQAHTDRNAARKLTPAEKREKKERKLFDDPNTVETIVSVYKVNKKITHPKTKFKVEMNARQNKLTGCSVAIEGMSVVVAEGKSKAINRFGKVMLRRINWEQAEKDEEMEEDDEEEDNERRGENKCWLVWQGSVAKQSFYKFLVQDCLTDSAAKKIFTDAGVGHYWDLALNYSDD